MPLQVFADWFKKEDFTESLFEDGEYLILIDKPGCYSADAKNIYITCESENHVAAKYALLEMADKYEYIFTFNDEVLRKLPGKAIRILGIPGADGALTTDTSKKEFKISGWCSGKGPEFPHVYGYRLRRHIYEHQKELPNTFFFRSQIHEPHLPDINNNEFLGRGKDGRERMFETFQFSIQIENNLQTNYFTEKLLDCLLKKTIPIYWGCPNIGDYFDTSGWILFNNFEELKDKISKLTPEYYSKYTATIEHNAQEALKYANWKQNFETLFSGLKKTT